MLIRTGLNVDRVVVVASRLEGGTLLELKGVRFCAARDARLIVRLCNYRLGRGWLRLGAADAIAFLEKTAIEVGIALVPPTDQRAAGKLGYFDLGSIQ